MVTAEQLQLANYIEQKQTGAFFTPERIVNTLLSWAVRKPSDRLLDPSCGDGRFIAKHKKSVGIEQSPSSAAEAMRTAPWALVHEGDFFAWALHTKERFECTAGNPPFIRYQNFKGEVRAAASAVCAKTNVQFSGLASSWAPFLVAAASLLKIGGRMAFVVPAEIGHAPYAKPLLEYLLRSFSKVRIVAIRKKLFEGLSEDCWLLYADGFGGSTSEIEFTVRDNFEHESTLPTDFVRVSSREMREDWDMRLRPYLLPRSVRNAYKAAEKHATSFRLGDVAQIGIGYVSGANDFFHLKPSTADALNIPKSLLRTTVRNSRALPHKKLTVADVNQWIRQDDKVLLLEIPKNLKLPSTVMRYLNSDAGLSAREAFKCRNRAPWYSVPDIRTPDYFLTYMSGESPSLVKNEADCTCTNSLHAIQLKRRGFVKKVQNSWHTPFTQLSCELEGHPLGGGMLKLEVREAGNIIMGFDQTSADLLPYAIEDSIQALRAWRHHGN